MGQGVRTGLGHGGITCVLQTQFSSLVSKMSSSIMQIRNANQVIGRPLSAI